MRGEHRARIGVRLSKALDRESEDIGLSIIPGINESITLLIQCDGEVVEVALTAAIDIISIKLKE